MRLWTQFSANTNVEAVHKTLVGRELVGFDSFYANFCKTKQTKIETGTETQLN